MFQILYFRASTSPSSTVEVASFLNRHMAKTTRNFQAKGLLASIQSSQLDLLQGSYHLQKDLPLLYVIFLVVSNLAPCHEKANHRAFLYLSSIFESICQRMKSIAAVSP